MNISGPFSLTKHWLLSLEVKLADFWVGCFWKWDEEREGVWHLWVCLLPCLPLHFTWQGQCIHKMISLGAHDNPPGHLKQCVRCKRKFVKPWGKTFYHPLVVESPPKG